MRSLRRERFAQRRRSGPGVAAGERLAPEPEALFEAVGVERARRQRHGVAASFGAHELLTERRTQP